MSINSGKDKDMAYICTYIYRQQNIQFSSVQFSHSVMSDSLRPHKLQHARPPCPSPTPGVHPNSCPSSWWCHPAISSCVVPFSSCPQSLPASESFPMSQLFAWGILLIHKKEQIVPFVEMWMDLCYTEWSKSERENQISSINTYMWNLKKWYRWTYLQNRNTDTDVENKHMNTKWGKREEMNWEIEIDIYTLLCIK